MFEHSHLPNVGLTEGKIPAEIYQALNKEIVDIHTNDRDIVRMNNSEEFFLNEKVGVVIKDSNVQILNIS